MFMTRCRWFVFGVVVVFAAVGVPARLLAQHPSSDAGPVLSLDSIDAVPDTQATVPVLYFPPPNQPPLTALTLRICLSEQYVKFVKVRPGMAGESGKAEVKVERTPKQDACTPIEVQVTFKAPPQKGTLLELLFDVDKKAPVDETVTVAATFEPKSASGEQSEPVTSTADLKIVKGMPVFACFLYMH
jgi:hypothetical protein